MKLDFTRLLAVYGALVSSCAVLWNIYRDFNDRAQIRLAAKIGYVRQDESGQELFVADSWLQDRGIRPEIRPFLKITITNTGRRKLTVTGWGAELKRGEQSPLLQVVPCHLPMELGEGQIAHEFTRDLTILGNKTNRIFARDSTGKYWRATRRTMRAVRGEYQAYLERISRTEQ